MANVVPLDFFAGVPIEESPAMLRRAWMAYDAHGAVVASGVLGVGRLSTARGRIAKIVMGADAYAALEKAVGPAA